MIVTKTTEGKYIVAIDDNNVRMLKEGKPMVLDLRKFMGHDDIVIFYAPTLTEALQYLETATGKPLPAAMPLPTGTKQ